MKAFLQATDIIDFHHPAVKAKAKALAENAHAEIALVKACFEFVRDEIRHSGDYPSAAKTTLKASEVLQAKEGWCYAKSHLLAALLRANAIPVAFCYQRLSCSEYQPDVFCLHGLNAIYLDGIGWYRVDARGNKQGVNAQFTPPREQLAFILAENEQDIEGLFEAPLAEVVEALSIHSTYQEMIHHFPDVTSIQT